jgi:hypothetical protein
MPCADLVADELRSLRELTHGPGRLRISSAHTVKLVELGYARETQEGIAITQLGRAVLAANLPDWLVPEAPQAAGPLLPLR